MNRPAQEIPGAESPSEYWRGKKTSIKADKTSPAKMAPKAKKADKGADKAADKNREQSMVDKTFGLKNKNKSKVVQKFVAQVTSAAKNGGKAGRPAREEDVKAAAKKTQQQKALLASLFNMAADKKGRVFDPKAKQKAKEKSREDEQSGLNVDDELQHKLIDGIKNAIRMSSAKGTQLSVIGGSAYVKDELDNKEYGKELRNLSLLAFIRRQNLHFWISDEEREGPVGCDIESFFGSPFGWTSGFAIS